MKKLALIFAVSLASPAIANPSFQDFPTTTDSCEASFVDTKPMKDCTSVLDGVAGYQIFKLDKVIATYSSTPCGAEFKLQDKKVSQKDFCESLVKETKSSPLKYSGSSCC